MQEPFPLLDTAAGALRANGQYRAELSADDLRRLILGVASGLLGSSGQIRAEILALGVEIVGSVGTASGRVKLTSPVSATLLPRLALGNDPDPSRIRLLDLRIDSEGGFMAKGMLRAVNLEGRARDFLADPNRALASVLGPELQARGAALTALGLHFTESTLGVELRGHAL